MANKTLTKTQFEQEFVNKINTELDLTLKRADGGVIMNTLRDMMIEHSTDERGCQYTGFFKCSVVKTNPRMGRNPATGETIKIPSKIRGKILLLKAFKDELAAAGAKAFGGKKSKTEKKEKSVKKSKTEKKSKAKKTEKKSKKK